MRLSLIHLMIFVLLLNVGNAIMALLGLVLGKGHPDLIFVVLLGIPAMIALSWPVMRRVNLYPLFWRCPQCRIRMDMLSLAYHPEVPDGLLAKASPCEHHFILLGKWRLEGSERVFHYSRRVEAILLNDLGAESGRRRARWPYWTVFWTKA